MAKSAAFPGPASTEPPFELPPLDSFHDRHIGPSPAEIEQMLATLGLRSLEELIDSTVPASIRLKTALKLPPALSEHDALQELRSIAAQNRVCRSLIGMGYYGTRVPPVIQRNILENPGWYTQYTPYQAEIAQGRLEALLNFQTMVADLTGLPMANASLLDEATAAAEAMAMCHSLAAEDERRTVFFVAQDCHPQTVHVLQTRAEPLGLSVQLGDPFDTDFETLRPFGALVQYPATDGRVSDFEPVAARVHQAGAQFVMAADLLALTMLKPPGEHGADIAIGSAQRFGVPMCAGGPHAAYIACRDEFKRQLPGRIVGVSRDAHGNPAYRLAIQTREQHIRREKATSNICTAQVLLAVMASMYAVYHGPAGLRRIAERVRALTCALRAGLLRLDHECLTPAGPEDATKSSVRGGASQGRATSGESFPVFDTLRVRPAGRTARQVLEAASRLGLNLRDFGDGTLGVALDELSDETLVQDVLLAFGATQRNPLSSLLTEIPALPPTIARRTPYLTHPVFNTHHCEHELLRYIKRLEARDLSLTTSMIPLGSCTMKLNAAAEMLPISWPEFANLHPFAPADQMAGYAKLCGQLEDWLAEITGFAAVSLQPNAGSQGEYAGLLAIRAYHRASQRPGAPVRDVCLIPTSAHGTNPASAVMAGLRVIAVQCDPNGNVDVADLREKVAQHADRLAALMITYPSTHGVFEESIRDICRIVHEGGGLVYMDGANMNAQVGITRPADIGADVCHLNLHKTFCIPHGGGGPGMGPICVTTRLKPFLPAHPLGDAKAASTGFARLLTGAGAGAVSAAPFGSAGILPIPWMYVRMMGADGLTQATRIAILNANYMAERLQDHYPVLFRGERGRVAHEFILDCRPFEHATGVKVEDIAKRLMDYGFHAPTMSFPVPGTLMIEPTESEPKDELDRLCDALIAIREEIRAIETGAADRADNPLKQAPHTALVVSADAWEHRYSRQQAAYPAQWLREHKFWPAVGRIDNVYGDRNLFCTCPPM